MDKEIDDLINSIKDLELIKRINELETIIDSDDSIMENFKELTDIQKKMINSKYYSKQNAYLEYEK